MGLLYICWVVLGPHLGNAGAALGVTLPNLTQDEEDWLLRRVGLLAGPRKRRVEALLDRTVDRLVEEQV